MDPLSITTGCLSLVGTIAKVSLTINTFVRTAREARRDLDSISRELLSLRTVLELLAQDTQERPKAIPNALEKQISSIISNCGGVLQDIEKSLQRYEEGKMKSMKWAWSGRDDVGRLRATLEAHKSALQLALDMIAL
jgi:Fungal N-terminal domain of STAND proteins